MYSIHFSKQSFGGIMKSFLFSVFALVVFSLQISSQDIKVIVHDPPVEVSGNFDWATDLVAFNNEPWGPVSGVVRATDTIYIAVPDTNGFPTGGLRILKSSNNGATWAGVLTVSGVGNVVKSRMLRSGLDTVYCTFRNSANNVYNLRVNLPLADPVRAVWTGSYRDFDCWASSTGGYYIFLDSLGSNNLRRYGSTNGGVSWSQVGLVSSASAGSYIFKSLTGDTAVLMYYRDPFVSDTTTQGITLARYRESGAGLLSSVNFIQPLIPAGLQRDQFAGILVGSTGWVVYTEGAPGSRNLMLLTSTNNGANWNAPVALTAGTADKYWFDMKPFSLGSAGVDLVYYWDSTGGPSNVTDKILYRSANVSTPGTFSAPEQISQFYPQFSTRRYAPTLVEYYNASGDVGAFWVGVDGGNRRLYYDRLNATVGINPNQNGVPETYSLSQNYPNPFNPSTKIEFAIPKEGFVSLKVFDVLGREVALLVNGDFKAGGYTVDYDASMLPSGIYFYKLTSGGFTETKKMILVK